MAPVAVLANLPRATRGHLQAPLPRSGVFFLVATEARKNCSASSSWTCNVNPDHRRADARNVSQFIATYKAYDVFREAFPALGHIDLDQDLDAFTSTLGAIASSADETLSQLLNLYDPPTWIRFSVRKREKIRELEPADMVALVARGVALSRSGQRQRGFRLPMGEVADDLQRAVRSAMDGIDQFAALHRFRSLAGDAVAHQHGNQRQQESGRDHEPQRLDPVRRGFERVQQVCPEIGIRHRVAPRLED